MKKWIRLGCPQDIDFSVTPYIGAERRCAGKDHLSKKDVRRTSIIVSERLSRMVNRCLTDTILYRTWTFPAHLRSAPMYGVTEKSVSYRTPAAAPIIYVGISCMWQYACVYLLHRLCACVYLLHRLPACVYLLRRLSACVYFCGRI